VPAGRILACASRGRLPVKPPRDTSHGSPNAAAPVCAPIQATPRRCARRGGRSTKNEVSKARRAGFRERLPCTSVCGIIRPATCRGDCRAMRSSRTKAFWSSGAVPGILRRQQAVHNHTGCVIQQAHRLRNGANLVESRARPCQRKPRMVPVQVSRPAAKPRSANSCHRNQNQGAHSAILSACVQCLTAGRN